jgi:hypothetical protein
MSTIKIPIRTVYDNSNQPVGLAEFQTDEVVGLDHGGTGANSAANARIALQISDSNIRSLFSSTGSIAYNNTTGVFSFTQGNTDTIVEGVSNLFFNNLRSRSSISVAGAGSYDSATGVITITGGVTQVNGQTGNVVLSTANIQETTNLYFTNARARTAFTAGSGIEISNGTISVASTVDYGLIDGAVTASNDYGSI